MGDLIEFKAGTAADWVAAGDPILREDEPGWDRDNGILRVGDGVTRWSKLPNAGKVMLDRAEAAAAAAEQAITGVVRVIVKTKAQFQAENPLLPPSTIARESDTNNEKIGDGVNAYLALPYRLTQASADQQYAKATLNGERAVGQGELMLNVKAFGAKGDGVTDDTAAIQATLNTAMADGGSSVYFPPGTYMVSTVGIDYSGSEWPLQAQSGPPYGFRAPVVFGSATRKSIIQQIAGSTGNVFNVRGKIGTQSGPSNNNKVTGFRMHDIEIQGTSTGGHGFYMRAAVNSGVHDVWIRNAGKSGIRLDRETFVSGVNDEYMYALSFRTVKLVSNAEWGFECSGTNSIGGSLMDVEAIGNGQGGFKLAPTNMNLYGCQAIGNGVGKIDGRGLLAIRNTNVASVNNNLFLVGFRSEGNSAVGGYEVEIQGGLGYVVIEPSMYPTNGAHCFGVGVTNSGNNQMYVQAFKAIGGFYGVAPTQYASQKAFVFGSDARDPEVDGGRINYGGSAVTPDALITLGGALRPSVRMNANMRFLPNGTMSFTRVIPDGTAVPAVGGEAQLYARFNASGKMELVAQFQSGAAQVIATQP